MPQHDLLECKALTPEATDVTVQSLEAAIFSRWSSRRRSAVLIGGNTLASGNSLTSVCDMSQCHTVTCHTKNDKKSIKDKRLEMPTGSKAQCLWALFGSSHFSIVIWITQKYTNKANYKNTDTGPKIQKYKNPAFWLVETGGRRPFFGCSFPVRCQHENTKNRIKSQKYINTLLLPSVSFESISKPDLLLVESARKGCSRVLPD